MKAYCVSIGEMTYSRPSIIFWTREQAEEEVKRMERSEHYVGCIFEIYEVFVHSPVSLYWRGTKIHGWKKGNIPRKGYETALSILCGTGVPNYFNTAIEYLQKCLESGTQPDLGREEFLYFGGIYVGSNKGECKDE